jgi:hypothetical protein
MVWDLNSSRCAEPIQTRPELGATDYRGLAR